jgi:hypothetical protein
MAVFKIQRLGGNLHFSPKLEGASFIERMNLEQHLPIGRLASSQKMTKEGPCNTPGEASAKKKGDEERIH